EIGLMCSYDPGVNHPGDLTEYVPS
ncbi:MAG: hypothetical protein ACI9C1_004124, partial [Candidatus Aldehydirespiratoraceae bacterium]